MTFLTLDIETVPQAKYVKPDSYLIRGAGPSGVQVEEEWLTERAMAEEAHIDDEILRGNAPLEATHVVPALHATTCHIVQVSFGWRGADGELCRKIVQADKYFRGLDEPFDPLTVDVAKAEPLLVADALALLRGACGKKSTIVTFNGKQFDIPLFRARMAILAVNAPGVYVPWRRLLYPYDDNQSADLRLILSGDDRRARGTLQWWADSMGIHAEEHGREVYQWVRAGRWDLLEGYGMTEAQTLVEMYERVQPIL